MARKKRTKVDSAAPQQGGFGSLGSLLQAGGVASSKPASQPETRAAGAPNAAPSAGKPGRVVLRREKKGRRGKTVTTITRHGLDDEALAALAKRLRKALGCGAGVEGDVLVLQGDQRDRAAQLLEADGWRVVRG
jgi:translation initiation factor 1